MMMTCREVRDYLTDYLAGDLSLQERDELERHVQACRHCAQNVDATRNVLHIARAALADMDEPSAADVPGSLIQAIKSHQPATAAVPGLHLAQLQVQFSEVPIRL